VLDVEARSLDKIDMALAHALEIVRAEQAARERAERAAQNAAEGEAAQPPSSKWRMRTLAPETMVVPFRMAGAILGHRARRQR